MYIWAILAAGLLLLRRGLQLRHIKKGRDGRIFFAFWFWPAAAWAYVNFFPAWKTSDIAFNTVLLALGLLTLVDFLFYFGLKSDQPKRQWLAAALVVPFLALTQAARFLPSRETALYLPHHGEALVWTQPAISPKVYFFMVPESKTGKQRGADYDDPNYGKAVFSPLAGKVLAFENGTVSIQSEEDPELIVEIGPLIPESFTRPVGSELFPQMPIGLLATSETIPGIRVAIKAEGRYGFRDLQGGMFFLDKKKRAVPQRNWLVRSVSETRFKLR